MAVLGDLGDRHRTHQEVWLQRHHRR
jgi:hypothetical protein